MTLNAWRSFAVRLRCTWYNLLGFVLLPGTPHVCFPCRLPCIWYLYVQVRFPCRLPCIWYHLYVGSCSCLELPTCVFPVDYLVPGIILCGFVKPTWNSPRAFTLSEVDPPPGGLREEIGMKTYFHGPMDYAKTLKLRFRVGDLDPPERRKRHLVYQ